MQVLQCVQNCAPWCSLNLRLSPLHAPPQTTMVELYVALPTTTIITEWLSVHFSWLSVDFSSFYRPFFITLPSIFHDFRALWLWTFLQCHIWQQIEPFVLTFLLNKSHVSEYAIYCSVLLTLSTRIESSNYITFKYCFNSMS